MARMAVSESSDIYNNVLHLLNSKELTFDHVHWQIDCQWDEGIESRWKNFQGWLEGYNKGISKLVEYWLDEMKKGETRGIVPFLGIFKNILKETKTPLPCGAGLDSFAIRTDGKITFCPLPPEYEKSVVGDIQTSTPSSVMNSALITEPCIECEVFDLCGGRCLFANLYKLWGKEGFGLVCRTVKHLIKELKGIKEEVVYLIENGIIYPDDLDYPNYNNTTEIIP
ncbi:MAG: SPASM domain-containing protein [Candidatus Heimdallarchaeota archaeon]